MKDVLEPLAVIPGVRLAAMISMDGVPICALDGVSKRTDSAMDRALRASAGDLTVFAGLAAAWLHDATRAIGPLSWDNPGRVVLSATRGTLVLNVGPGAAVLVLLENGVAPEEVRVPMDGAIGRMHRMLKGIGRAVGQPYASTDGEPPAALPAATDQPSRSPAGS